MAFRKVMKRESMKNHGHESREMEQQGRGERWRQTAKGRRQMEHGDKGRKGRRSTTRSEGARGGGAGGGGGGSNGIEPVGSNMKMPTVGTFIQTPILRPPVQMMREAAAAPDPRAPRVSRVLTRRPSHLHLIIGIPRRSSTPHICFYCERIHITLCSYFCLSHMSLVMNTTSIIFTSLLHFSTIPFIILHSQVFGFFPIQCYNLVIL